jgi:RNA polymerase sigma-70 factor (ECF subfamily)
VDDAGGYVSLDEQDRSRWDRHMIVEGLRVLERAARLAPPDEYQLQAAIAALHLRTPDSESVDWAGIATLYEALARLRPSPVVEVNRAAAVGFAAGPDAGLAILRPLLADPALDRYQPLHATHAELLRRAGDLVAAARAYERAIELSTNPMERAELARRLRALST